MNEAQQAFYNQLNNAIAELKKLQDMQISQLVSSDTKKLIVRFEVQKMQLQGLKVEQRKDGLIKITPEGTKDFKKSDVKLKT